MECRKARVSGKFAARKGSWLHEWRVVRDPGENRGEGDGVEKVWSAGKRGSAASLRLDKVRGSADGAWSVNLGIIEVR